MIPHNLETVKVRKQYYRSSDILFDEYCFPWSSFFAKLELDKSRNLGSQVCSHCNVPMSSAVFPPGRITTRHVLSNTNPVQCTVCKRYSCRPWSRNSECPEIKQCQHCLEWSCSCQDEVVMCVYCRVQSCPGCDPDLLTCHGCGLNSCSKCNRMTQCKYCFETSCQNCPNDLFTCYRCNASYCENCVVGLTCNICSKTICVTCDESDSGPEFTYCDQCLAHVCNGCQSAALAGCLISTCQWCGIGLCRSCSDLGNRQRVDVYKVLLLRTSIV